MNSQIYRSSNLFCRPLRVKFHKANFTSQDKFAKHIKEKKNDCKRKYVSLLMYIDDITNTENRTRS